VQLIAQLAQVQKGEDRSGRAAFHVAGAAPIDAAVDQLGAPRVVRPAGAIAHREAVDMAVECQVTPGFPGLERRHHVRHHLVGCDHPILGAMPLQELRDMARRLTRVAGRVRARIADEAAQEIEQDLAVALDPLQQFCFAAFHVRFSGRVVPLIALE
jgi:hypothetical protein